MEKKSKGKNIVIVILVLVVLGLVGYIVYDKKNNENKIADYDAQLNDLKKQMEEYKENSKSSETFDNEITLKDLYGTYKWEKDYTNESGNKLSLKVQLILNPDGSASYNASNGYDAEMTKGSYVYKDGKIIYTREYYNYDNASNDLYTDNLNKTEIFIVVDKNTLQNKYYDQTTELKK